MFLFRPVPVLRRSASLAALMGLALLAGCGGGGSNPPPPPPAAVAPAISTQPSSLTVTAPQPASFSVTASGTAPLQYQWTKNGANVGTNATTFSLATTATTDAGSYTVIVSNTAGSVTSNAALLTVNAASAGTAVTGVLVGPVGTQVVLLNNAADNLNVTIAPDAVTPTYNYAQTVFTFAAKLLDGAAYSVSVASV